MKREDLQKKFKRETRVEWSDNQSHYIWWLENQLSRLHTFLDKMNVQELKTDCDHERIVSQGPYRSVYCKDCLEEL